MGQLLLAVQLLTSLLAPHQTPPGATGAAPQASTLTGRVRDDSRPVPGADVIVRTPDGREARTTTGPDGRFTLPMPAATECTIIVRAGGFADTTQSMRLDGLKQPLEVPVTRRGWSDTVTVTAERTEHRLADTPASVSVVGRDRIAQSPAVVVDDVLRQVPTFSLFRRTSSLSSHPTSQGVSLRGLGPSGVSRTLVLLDGVPFNDPFGGWVYWSRASLGSIDRVEVVNGLNSSLYGNYAMGGVINLASRPATPRTLDVQAQTGTRASPKVDVFASDVWHKVGVSFDGSGFRTDGYPIVAAGERGLVDNNATVAFQTFNLKLDYAPTDRVRTFVRSGYFHESRANGKASTIDGTEESNRTRWTTVTGGTEIQLPDNQTIDATVTIDRENFRSNFLAVPAVTPSRSIGRMTLNQTVPTNALTAAVQWSRAFTPNLVVSAGGDLRHVDGDSLEEGLDATFGQTVTLTRNSGGTQLSGGAYARALVTLNAKAVLTLSARLDHWRSYRAHNLESNYPSGTPTANDNPALPGKHDTVVSPQTGMLYHLTDRVTVWGNAGTGFRAPTLNELYRQFRVGNTLTLPNNALGPERLKGGEIGATVEPIAHLSWRSSWFYDRVSNPVSNVTILVVGLNTTQQRQNLGRTTVSGIQTEAEYRIGTAWRVGGGFVHESAVVTAFAANPALVGKDLPQVARNRGSVQVSWTHSRIGTLAVSVEAIGRQFDDDLNTRVIPGQTTPGLPAYAIVSVSGSHRINRRLELYAGAQNLFNRLSYVATQPSTIGTPRLVNGGLRLTLAPR